MISIENLYFSYNGDGKATLADINLSVEDGEHLALIGPNGCGKTTLIQHLNALILPEKGKVVVDGLATDDPRNRREIRRRVGMVFQNPDNQIVGMTVEEDIAFGPGNLGLPSQEIKKRVDEALDAAGIPNLAERDPNSLSAGEKRLVAVAGVLATKPRHIALDEPTSHLDPSGKERLLALIRKLNDEGFTIIHVTHNMDEVAQADRVVVMLEGRILKADTPKAIFSDPETLRRSGLGIPGAIEILQRLRDRGWNVRTDILTTEQACEEIAACLKRKDAAW